MASSAPWTPGDLRKNARSWTLEGDAKLLEYMQTISENLEKRAQNTNSKMNQLVLNLEETSVSLDNMTNKLSALQHSQFVENRVYEDDETIANESEVPVDVQNEKETYDPIETLNKVLKNSIAMMDKCYEKVSIDVEDSDDEEGLTKSIVYKPKNFFEHRPLPHIIGSKEWKEKWHIGLCDTDEEYSDEENKEEYSDTSENVSLSASLPSNAPTLSESESSVWGLHPHMNVKRPPVYSPSSDEEVSSNTMTSKTSSEDINRLNNNKQIIPPPQVPPPPEQRYYVHKPKEKGLFDESSNESEEETSKQSQKVQPIKQPTHKSMVNGISNIINDEPPELDEVDRREDNESNQLFYESEEDNRKKGVENAERAKTDSFSNIRKKPVNLFDDDDFDSFMKELDKKATEKLSQNNTKNVTNLFNDTLEDEPDPLVAADPPKLLKTETVPVVSERKIFKKTLFDDEPEEDKFFASVTQKPKSSIATEITKKVRNLFDDDSSDDDFENIFKSNSKSVNKKEFEKDSTENIQVKGNGSINNSDELFENIQNNNSSNPNHSATLLFSNEPPEDDIFKEDFKVPKANKRIDTTKSDDVLNKNLSILKVNESVKTVEGEFDKSKKESTASGPALFSTDDEDDLFGSLSRPPVPTPRSSTEATSKAQSTSNPVNVDDTNKLFENTVTEPVSSVEEKSDTISESMSTKTTSLRSLGLFEDENESNNKINIGAHSIEIKRPTLSNIFFDDGPPDDDDIFNISKKGDDLQKFVSKSEEETKSSDNTNNVEVLFDKMKSSVNPEPISSQFKLPDLFDNESLNDLQKEISQTVNVEIESSNSDKLKDTNVSSDNIENTENTINSKSISSKFKLPSLFDDEPPSDDDDLFGSLSKNTVETATSDYESVINSVENEQIITESKTDTLPEDVNISNKLKNQNQIEVDVQKEKLQSIVEEKGNLKTSDPLEIFNEENISQENKKDQSPQFQSFEEPPTDDNILEKENKSSITVMEEGTSPFKENELNTASINKSDSLQKIDNSNIVSQEKESVGGQDSQPNTSLYNSINLFQDIPPDDDFPTSSDTKRLHNIFYDDFAETIPTTSTYSRKQPSNYFFSDEPPPDSFDDDTISDTEKELPKSEEKSKPSPILPTEELQKVEEVSGGLGQSEIDNKTFSVADLIKKAGTEPEYKKPKTKAPVPKKLNTNLNINVAALMPGAKRPNLKTEDSIQKQSSTEDEESSSSSSLFSNPLRQSSTESMPSSIATVVTPSKSADPNILPNLTKSRPKMQGKRPSTREGRQEKYRKSLILDVTDSIPNQSSSSSIEQVVESKSNNTSEEKQSNALIDSHQHNVEKIENSKKSKKDDLPEDDWLIKSIQSETISPPSQPRNDKKLAEASKGFNDVNDDDDLFASVGKAVQERTKLNNPAEIAAPEIKAIPEPAIVKPKEPPKSEAKASKSLFTDDESDDDLFGKVQKKVKAPFMKTPAVSSKDKIFSSDDDDDDIFGKTLKESRDDNKTEKKLLKRLPMPSSKSLFGDDDDDDDIFGTSTTQTKVQVNRVVTAPKKPEKRSPIGSITGDNPLSDLLND